MENFTSLTDLSWDGVSNIRPKSVQCPNCASPTAVQSTACMESASRKSLRSTSWKMKSDAVDELLASGNGYCDKDFETQCTNCKTPITHDRLKAAKFCDDVKLLLERDVPMGGTVLGMEGIPWQFESTSDVLCASLCNVPNSLLEVGLGATILSAICAGKGPHNGARGSFSQKSNIGETTKDWYSAWRRAVNPGHSALS